MATTTATKLPDASLRHQMEALQQLQQAKLARRKERAKEQDKTKENKKKGCDSFGIQDDLDLKLDETDEQKTLSYSEELITNLYEQIRELKDETGRLCKLLAERDFEIRSLKQKTSAKPVEDVATRGLTNETAATKIVELSRKLRDMTTELESEKTTTKQLTRKYMELQNTTTNGASPKEHSGLRKSSSATSLPVGTPGGDNAELPDTVSPLKSLQDKLKHSELKAAEYRNQSQALKQELKLAQKVLTSEVGQYVTPQSLLNAPGGWRGRAQQIIMLQKKVNELKSQLNEQQQQQTTCRTGVDAEDDTMASLTYRRPTATDRSKGPIWKAEKERREVQERTAAHLKALELDYETSQQKLEASKARNKVLQNELKLNKQQMQTLLVKGQHDNDLIQALFKQQAQLNSTLESSTTAASTAEQHSDQLRAELAQLVQQHAASSAELKRVADSKEEEVRELQRLMMEMKASESAVDADVVQQVEPAVSPKSQQDSRQDVIIPTTASESNHSPVARDNRTLSDTPPSIHTEPAAKRGGSGGYSRSGTARSRKICSQRQSPVLNNKPLSPKTTTTAESNDIQAQCYEYKLLCQSSQVERDKLSELVQVLHSRLQCSSQATQQVNDDLVSERRRNAMLEKLLEKAKLGGTGKKVKIKTPRCSGFVRDSLECNDDHGTVPNLEELETDLMIQRDENSALKEALASTLRGKQQDLALYNEMLEDTKQLFLRGLRQYQQGAAPQ